MQSQKEVTTYFLSKQLLHAQLTRYIVYLMLGQRRRRSTNMEPTKAQYLMFAGMLSLNISLVYRHAIQMDTLCTSCAQFILLCPVGFKVPQGPVMGNYVGAARKA